MEFFSKKQKLSDYRIRRTFKESIEPEDVLLDAKKHSSLAESKLELPINSNVFRVFLILAGLAIFALLAQSFNLQVIKQSQYAKLSEQNRVRAHPVFSQRGIIYDRSFNQLVYNVPSFDLTVFLNDLPEQEAAKQNLIKKISGILGLSVQEIQDKIFKAADKKQAEFVLIENINYEKVLKMKSEFGETPGLALNQNIVRQYVDGPYFSHLLGYTGYLDSASAAKNPDYFLTEKIGKQGLEAVYENILRGRPGVQEVEADAVGEKKAAIISRQPQAGQGLVLTIDKDLQKKITDDLNKQLQNIKTKRAAAAAINPQTGAVLAMVSLPSFDNNLFAQGISAKDFNSLLNNPDHPLLNYVISGEYSPGSTIKPMLGAAALQEGIIKAGTAILDTGEIVLPNQYDSSVVYHFRDWKTHGVVNLYSAIAESCDVYFYTIGGGYGNITGLGADRIKKYLEMFGFGKTTGIDLPGEKDGLLPDAAWKQQYKNEQWFTGDTYHISIGQGDMLVTPLQMAQAVAAIANGGKLYAPYLVDKIVDSDKNIIKQTQPKILNENFISAANMEIIRQAMRQAVTDGTARSLNDLSFETAGKTGTAQVGGQTNTNAWFEVFAPFDNPQIALVVLVDNAGEGSQVAIPVAKEALNWYFTR